MFMRTLAATSRKTDAMTQESPTAKPSFLHQALSLLAVVAIILLIPGIVAYDYVVAAQRISISVKENAASEDCRNGLAPGRRNRFVRNMGGVAYAVGPDGVGRGPCGFIVTDVGTFRLPERNKLQHILDEERPKLHAALDEGCRYEVTAIGKRSARPGDAIGNYPIFRIVRIERKLGCRTVFIDE